MVCNEGNVAHLAHLLIPCTVMPIDVKPDLVSSFLRHFASP